MKNLALFLFAFCVYQTAKAQTDYAHLVNPLIGTGGHGHTFPGATTPHGMVQLSPDTRLEGWDGCGGYHYDDHFIYGFTHTHLSGTGVPDFCDILVMPMSGEPSPNDSVYGSSFSHEHEKAWAGYYSVLLDKGNIQTEFTSTDRVGLHHYTFSQPGDNTVILDLKHRDEVLESTLKLEDSVTVSGLRRSRYWAQNQYCYFVMKFSKPIRSFGLWDHDSLRELKIGDSLSSKDLKAFFRFDLSGDKNMYVKVALSLVSAQGAAKNLAAELPGWDFQKTLAAAEKKWNNELGKIEVQGDETKKKIFYTALYHTAVVPNVNMDVDRNYRGRDNRIHHADDFTYYSVFSLWDTYRATHPLYTIIDRRRTLDYIKTFLAQYQQGGKLPVWELASNETECMIGYHCIPVIVDAYLKGIKNFDTALALKAMVHSANLDHYGLAAYKSKGMIETGDESENVSRTLEYAYDDWCIAMFAKAIGNMPVYEGFIKRAQYYKNVLDPETGFMRPRVNGDRLAPFDPRQVDNNYTEANSWQYSFYMPQDIAGYLKILGGKKALEKKLDDLFTTSSVTTGRDQSDISGLIGQYAHGNEPSHHIAYLYDYTDAPFKTQEKVHRIMTDFYKDAPDGLIGNEDCGQMSAWYVMSAMGFYPVTPGTNYFNAGTPAFTNIRINSGSGKYFTVIAPAADDRRFYVTGNLNGGQIKYADIINGGSVNFAMTDRPAHTKVATYVPAIYDSSFVLNPVIHGGGIPFRGQKVITISAEPGTSIFYTGDGTEPTNKSTAYSGPLEITGTGFVKAIAYNHRGDHSFITTAEYRKAPNDWTITSRNAYENEYDGNGPFGLIDGMFGTTDWRRGNWQGYQGADLDVTIDLKKIDSISTVTADFLQDTNAWIVMPKDITVEVSTDGTHFEKVYGQSGFLPIEDLKVQVKAVTASFPKTAARYVRYHATQFGKLPAWHEGAGSESHIFVDEIQIGN